MLALKKKQVKQMWCDEEIFLPEPGQSEHDDQCRVCEWMDSIGLLYHAIPNAGKRSYLQAAFLRAEGMRKGVPDLFIAEPRGAYHGMYLEMKSARGGRLSKEQKETISLLRWKGYYVAVAHGYEDAITQISDYSNGTV